MVDRKNLYTCILALCLTLFMVNAFAAVKYVSSSGSDANDGLSWTTPKGTINSAINASVSGDQVWVKMGTYTNASAATFVTLKPGISVYGGFVGNETLLSQRDSSAAAASTILDGNNTYSVLGASGVLTTANVFDGFTLQHGKSTSTSGGGGIYLLSNGPTAGNFTIQNCVIKNNLTSGASSYGAGIYSSSTYAAYLNCSIINNTATYYGGGVYIISSSTQYSIMNECIISGNAAGSTAYGGGAYFSTDKTILANSLVANNSSYVAGGLYVTGAAQILNNTIVNNSASSTSTLAGGMYVTSSTALVANNIVESNSAGGINVSSSTTVVKYNDSFNNGTTTQNFIGFTTLDPSNFSADAGFNNASSGDYSLNNASVAVDAASTSYVYGTTDLLGNPRSYGASPDLGAYERQTPITSVAAPFFSLPAGTYNDYQTVTVTEPLAGATIYYTTDGSTPTTSSQQITSGSTISISTSQVLKAIAVRAGLNNSSVTTAAYNLIAATPTFNPDAKIAPATVTIVSATPNSSIYYTTDGSLPSAANGTLYLGPVIVNGPSTTLRAVAVKTGLQNSLPKTALYRTSTTILYVDNSTGTDGNDGLSWTSAKRTIGAALLNAYIAGDQVYVASGIYNERVTVKSGVALYGGFLNGQTLANRDFRTNHSSITAAGVAPAGPVVTIQSGSLSNTIVDGFTITGGTNPTGAGILATTSAPTIRNNIIRNNTGTNGGSGIYLTTSSLASGAVIDSNIVRSNNLTGSSGAGAGIYVSCSNNGALVVNNIIENNSSAYGAGMYILGNPTIINNTIAYNNTVINTNTANSGAGIYSPFGNATAQIQNNIIAFNTAGLYATTSTVISNYNDVFGNTAGNYAGSGGFGAGANDISANPLFVNGSGSDYHLTSSSPAVNAGNSSALPGSVTLDFEGNSRISGSSVDMGAYELAIAGSTMHGTVVLQGWLGSTLPQIVVTVDNGVPTTVNLTPVNTTTGTFNITLPASGMHSVKVKPNGFLSQSTSFTTSGGTVNFTFNGGAAAGNAGLIPGDLNNDNTIDDGDLLIVINNFLNPPPSGVFDANGDNVLDDSDLLDVINNFLTSGS